MSRQISVLLACTVLLTGCGRGCMSEPVHPSEPTARAPQPAATPNVPAAPAAAPKTPAGDRQSLPARVAADLKIAMPRRLMDGVLPGLATAPRRKLAQFDTARELIVTLAHGELSGLGDKLTGESVRDEAALAAFYERLATSWQRRAGIPATRLVLAIDRQTPGTTASVVVRVATMRTWAVRALAREGDDLFELVVGGPGPAKAP